MRIAQVHGDRLALNRGLEADADDLEPLDEAGAHPLDHVVNKGPGQSVHRLRLGIVTVPADLHLPSSMTAVVRFGRSKESLPFRAPRPEWSAPGVRLFTLAGIGTGILPIRDINQFGYQT
jgi:hypothetical protein